MPDRIVRFTQQFFDELDHLLPDDRTSEGRPSITDFMLHELPRLRDQLANDLERNSLPVSGAEPVRVLVTAGILVASVAVYALLVDDVDVDVVGIDLDLWPSPDE